MNKKAVNEILKALTTVLQAGLCAVTPIFLFLLIAKYIVKRFSLGTGIIAVAIVLGAVCGLYNMFRFLYRAAGLNKKDRNGD